MMDKKSHLMKIEADGQEVTDHMRVSENDQSPVSHVKQSYVMSPGLNNTFNDEPLNQHTTDEDDDEGEGEDYDYSPSIGGNLRESSGRPLHPSMNQSSHFEAEKDVIEIIAVNNSANEKDFNATAIQAKSSLEPLALGPSLLKNSEEEKVGELPVKSNADINAQMLKEQREMQASATGHEFGSNQFKLVGIHILEMYNPLKQFLTSAGNAGKKDNDKEGTAKKEKKVPDTLNQIEKQMTLIKEKPGEETDILA